MISKILKGKQTMKTKWKIINALIIFSIFFAISAESRTHHHDQQTKPKRFPLGCENVGFSYKDKNVLLKPILTNQQQTIYFIHNLSPNTLHFESLKPADDLYALTYQTDIDPQRWAAFAFDFPQILFTCSIRQAGGEMKQLDCSTLLDICEYPCVKFPDHGEGDYWASENSSLSETIYNANRGMGILLKSCPKYEGGESDDQ